MIDDFDELKTSLSAIGVLSECKLSLPKKARDKLLFEAAKIEARGWRYVATVDDPDPVALKRDVVGIISRLFASRTKRRGAPYISKIAAGDHWVIEQFEKSNFARPISDIVKQAVAERRLDIKKKDEVHTRRIERLFFESGIRSEYFVKTG
jgi:hypothetical protein